MSKLTIISDKTMIKILNSQGLSEVRQKGSHKFFSDGKRSTVVPCHNEDLPRGTIQNILSDIDITIEEYERIRKNIN